MDTLIAWRNLWRNPGRTLVILAAIVTGVWFIIVFEAVCWGMIRDIVDNSIMNLTGHIRVSNHEYQNDPVIENSIRVDDSMLQKVIQVLPAESHFVGRIRIPAIAQNAYKTSSITVVGCDLRDEEQVSFLGKSQIDGDFPDPENTHQILVGQAFLELFETEIGKKVILMAQDEKGEISSRAFHIVGAYKANLESMEKSTVFIPKKAVDKLLLTSPETYSEISFMLPSETLVEQTNQKIQTLLGKGFSVETWKEREPLIAAYLKIFNFFSFVWTVVVFIVMSFGIVNTMLMAIYDRIREFGLIRALGMSPGRIIKGVLLESIMLLFLGLLVGDLLALGSTFVLKEVGINLTAFSASNELYGMSRVIYPAITLKDFIMSNALVLFLGICISFYPAIKASKFTPIEAMNHY